MRSALFVRKSVVQSFIFSIAFKYPSQLIAMADGIIPFNILHVHDFRLFGLDIANFAKETKSINSIISTFFSQIELAYQIINQNINS